MSRATSLAAAIEQSLGHQVELIKGDDGIFDVEADGELIYSKYKSGRFPDLEEVIAKLPPR